MKYIVVSVRGVKEGGSIWVVEGRKKRNQGGVKRDERG